MRGEAPPARVLAVLLAHQPQEQLAPCLRAWDPVVEPGGLLIAYGGTEENFQRLGDSPPGFFVNDPRLRTRDHQRERQSYRGVFQGAAGWLMDPAEPSRGDWTHVHVAEFDHVPLVPDLHARLVTQMRAENADVLGHRMWRIDDTSHPHYLYHAHGPEFGRWLAGFSRRPAGEERNVVLSMLGTGSIWTREAFLAVAAVPEPFPIYLELWLPTVAHHLGFRVRPFRGEAATGSVRNLGVFSARELARARRAGAWTAHPVKRLG